MYNERLLVVNRHIVEEIMKEVYFRNERPRTIRDIQGTGIQSLLLHDA